MKRQLIWGRNGLKMFHLHESFMIIVNLQEMVLYLISFLLFVIDSNIIVKLCTKISILTVIILGDIH